MDPSTLPEMVPINSICPVCRKWAIDIIHTVCGKGACDECYEEDKCIFCNELITIYWQEFHITDPQADEEAKKSYINRKRES